MKVRNRMYVMTDSATESVMMDREERVINHLHNSKTCKAYFVDVTQDPPVLIEAKLGTKNDVVARVINKQLLLKGVKVMESHIQETVELVPSEG